MPYSCASLGVSCFAVSIMTGISFNSGEFFRFIRVSQPSMGSIMISRRMRSGLTVESVSSASWPPYAATVWYPPRWSIVTNISTMNGLSSTTITVNIRMTPRSPWQGLPGPLFLRLESLYSG
ncbi:MAG: hypothetical protein A4E37_01760 [Methanoregulaceae archaeon PtaB.Bin056]|nr:MAG: hypothetical protein A4E37_01760 [Methanoregulaceae archaeon PtaB.Bin056]